VAGRLKEKVAIVTGAGSIGPGMGNGKATAILFAREGARVMLVDYNAEAAEETKHLIDNEGGKSMVFQADVSKNSDCKNTVEKCIKTFGRVDILHNNVGIGSFGGPVETSEEEWDKVMRVNVKSMFLTCKHTLPFMENQGNGSIINISSLVAVRTLPSPSVAYATSKAGVIAFTREVAIQYAAKGIRANVILPGFMKTPTQEYYGTKAWGGNTEEMWRRRDAMVPTGKQGEAWDIAYAALYLASDEAKYVTGTTLLVDGGITNIMSPKP
jgi:NAD(P)-dependent dehydrogenase (short-subunit alcohol dehydrogenase family)